MGVYLQVNFKNESDEAKFFGVSVDILTAAKKRVKSHQEEGNRLSMKAHKTRNWDAVDAHNAKLEGFDKHIQFFDLGNLRTLPDCSQEDWGGSTSDKNEIEKILGTHRFDCCKPEDAHHAYANIHLIASLSWY